MIQVIVTSLVTGLSILVVALFLNFIAEKLGILTWYDFVNEPSQASIVSYLWLFVVYPLLLGLSAYIVLALIKN